jgi:pimeloyl-ACP methyl ester carboxylesterase
MSCTVRSFDGVGLALERRGPSDGPAVVLLHGGGQTRFSWARTVDVLVASGFQTLCFDMRGHGESGWADNGDYSIAAQASDLAAIVSSLRPQRTALVGASIGGLTVLYHAARSQAAFAALVLIDVALKLRPEGANRLVEFMMLSAKGYSSVLEAATMLSEFYPRRRESPALRQSARHLRQGSDGRYYWHWDQRLFGERGIPAVDDIFQLSNDIQGNISSPTLLIRGGESEIVDDAGARHLRSLIPQLVEHVIPEAGHMVVGDDNDGFAVTLDAFLKKQFLLGS